MNNKLRLALINNILRIPGIDSEETRTSLISGMPISLSLKRSAIPRTDITTIVEQLMDIHLEILRSGFKSLAEIQKEMWCENTH